MWEWVLIAGIMIVGLGMWLAKRNAGAHAPQGGDAGTTFFATDSGSDSSSPVYDSTDCVDTGNDSSGCDGGGDGGGSDGGGSD
jgi:hypothetical protein